MGIYLWSSRSLDGRLQCFPHPAGDSTQSCTDSSDASELEVRGELAREWAPLAAWIRPRSYWKWRGES